MSNVMTYFFSPHKIIKDAHRCTDIYIYIKKNSITVAIRLSQVIFVDVFK